MEPGVPAGGLARMRAETPVALVTGANGGIGREVTRQLATAGFVVVAGSRDLGKGERAAREIDPTGHTVTACALDVTDQASIETAAHWVGEHLGRLDVLI